MKRKRDTKAPKSSEREDHLGIFDDDADDTATPRQIAEQAELDESVVRDFLGKGPTVCGVRMRTITFSDLAILQEANSIFVNFRPLLNDSERARLFALAELSESGTTLSAKEQKEFNDLGQVALEEIKMIKNTYMEVLKFLAIMDARITTEEASDLVCDQKPSVLRNAALAIGKVVEVKNFTETSKEIAALIRSVQTTRVEPRPNRTGKGSAAPGNS